MNPDGTELTRLTDDPGWDGTPAWSPDGTQIAFASERLGSPVIMLMNADGSDQRALTEATYASLMPVWSPDGAQIAFASTRSYEVQRQGGRQEVDGGFELWVMNADGSDPQRITGNPEDQSLYPCVVTRRQATGVHGGDRRSAHHGAGTGRWCKSHQRHRHSGRPALDTCLVARRPPDRVHEPTGRQVADIWLLDVKSGETTQLSQPDSNDSEPAWSPDGKELVFMSDRDGPQGLYIMSADGQNVRRLTTDSAEYAHPVWGGK